MNELTMHEIDEVNGGVSLAVAAAGIALGTAGFAAFALGVQAGYNMMNDYLKSQHRTMAE